MFSTHVNMLFFVFFIHYCYRIDLSLKIMCIDSLFHPNFNRKKKLYHWREQAALSSYQSLLTYSDQYKNILKFLIFLGKSMNHKYVLFYK